MDEDGAAAPRRPRPGVMIKLNDQVVQVVRTPKAVALLPGASFDRTIIPPIRGVFDPGVVRFNAPRWQQCPRMRQTVGPPPEAYQVERAARSGTVALALVGCDAGTT